MNISFIPSTSKLGYYDLYLGGNCSVVEISPEEVLNTIEDIESQKSVIEDIYLFSKALDLSNLSTPDPQVKPEDGPVCYLKVESPLKYSNKYLEAYDRVDSSGNSYIFFVLKRFDEYEEDKVIWAFFVGRNSKEIGRIIGSYTNPPVGETRQRIIEILTPMLGRDNIKISF